MNKHDELLKRIKETPDAGLYFFDAEHPRWTDETFVCITDELKSLADEYEKLREMVAEARVIDTLGSGKYNYGRWDDPRFDTALDAYAALKIQQSGEEGE